MRKQQLPTPAVNKNRKKMSLPMPKKVIVPGAKPLRKKKERFCQEFLVDMNIKEAAGRAGYKVENNSWYIYNMVKEPCVQDRIAYLQWQRQKRLQITQDRVLQEIASIAFFNVKDLYWDDGSLKELSSLTREEAAAISGIDVVEGNNSRPTVKKIKLEGKQTALMNLGKHLGMFKDTSLGDVALYELKERKARMDNLPEEDLIALSKIIRKASNDGCQSDGRGGGGNGLIGALPETLH
jgi:phage terminase small subunit